jgi:hypothetical protein
MRKEERFNNILNECLDRILKGESVENCLLSYPEQAQELEPLLMTAKAARVISTVQPRPEYRTEAKRQFQAALIEMKVKENECKAYSGRRFQLRWQSAWAIALVTVVIVVLGSGGAIAAASGSMPDSGLYPVKLATEKVQLALAPGQIAKTQLNAKFTERRVEEIIYTAEAGNAQETEIAAVRLNTYLSNISELAAGKAQSNLQSKGEATPLRAPQPAELSRNAAPSLMNTATDIAPVDAPVLSNAAPNRPSKDAAAGADESVTIASAEDNSAAVLSASQAAWADENTARGGISNNAQDAVRWAGPNSVKVTVTRFDKMAQIIQRNYDKRKAKLEEALQNASPKARPAIEQAIAQSDLEYERAMENLAEDERAQNSANSGHSPN